MKKYLIGLWFVYSCVTALGQSSIPNGTFESWTSGTFNYPENYPYNSNISTYIKQGIFNVTKTTDAFHGTNALQLATVTIPRDTAFAYMVNIDPTKSSPSVWHGGMPYDQIPTGIRGYYKYNVATADSASIIITFSKAGSNIRTYFYKIGGIKDDYTLFNFTFTPALSVTPDSVEFGALSCKFGAGMQQPHGVAGSILKLDSVSFTGVSSQPEKLNGDFELWQSQAIDFPAQWHSISATDQSTGVYQTTDAAEGNYAVELKTFLGIQDNQPAAQGGAISTGYFPVNCTNDCVLRGGNPFTNKKDTLIFSYKYAPSTGDQAVVVLNFKKNGINIFQTSVFLDASPSYQLKELPFNLGENPDTVIVSISSTKWENTLLSYIGSDLKIDDIYFKSQSVVTGINSLKSGPDNIISIFPNPSGGKFQIKSTGADLRKVEIFDGLGKEIYSNSKFNGQRSGEIDLSKYGKGIYFVKIYEGVNVHTGRIVVK
jgi:hypothetical protein